MHRRSFLAAIAGTALVGPWTGGRAAAEEVVRMRELYNRDKSFSDYALERDGRQVEIEGFMALPLKAESSFFVLTKMPMAVCPFCESEAEWPVDIVSVYSREVISVAPFNVPIRVAGTLKLGVFRDEELGFVSKVRVVDATYRRS